MTNTNFGVLLRRWRAVRHLSQLDLALDADISTRHLSCVETGRAQPSREMVLRLAEALQIPLRERNALLVTAGYAPLYPHSGVDRQEASAASHAVELFMAQLEPYPVLIVDRYWNMLKTNSGAKRFFALFPGCDSVTPRNGVRLVFHPNGLRPFIENWESVAARIIQRVHREVLANPLDDTMKGFLEELLGAGGSPLPALTANCFSAQFRRACRLIPHSSSSAPTAVIRHLQRKLQRWASPLLFMLTPMTEFPQR